MQAQKVKDTNIGLSQAVGSHYRKRESKAKSSSAFFLFDQAGVGRCVTCALMETHTCLRPGSRRILLETSDNKFEKRSILVTE